MYRFLSIGWLLVIPFVFQPSAANADDGRQRDGPPVVQTVQHRHHHHRHHGHGYYYHHHHYRPYGYNYYYYRPYSQRYYYRPYGGYYYRNHRHFDVQTPWFRFHIH